MGISWGYVGPAWELDCFSLRLGGPILELCWPILGLRCPILRATWAHLGAMLAHLGAVLAHLGAMLAHLGAMLAHFGGYVVPSWGLCCPILGLCSPILRPMLTHLEPQAPKKAEKNGRAKYPVKRRIFWRYEVVAGRGGGPSLLRRGEKRLRLCHGQGAPGRIFGLTPLVGSAGPLGPPFHRSVGVKVTE